MRPLIALSDGLARLERALVVALTGGLVALILLNVATRALGAAIYWVDELAIYVMIWLVFIGASYTLRLRRHVRVTALIGTLPGRLRAPLEGAIDAAVCAFCLGLIWMAWIWYDPAGIAAAGFDADAFSGATFNFIYDEPTNTLGIRKFWVWLIMPWFALTASLHAGANLAERLAGRAPPPDGEAGA